MSVQFISFHLFTFLFYSKRENQKQMQTDCIHFHKSIFFTHHILPTYLINTLIKTFLKSILFFLFFFFFLSFIFHGFLILFLFFFFFFSYFTLCLLFSSFFFLIIIIFFLKTKRKNKKKNITDNNAYWTAENRTSPAIGTSGQKNRSLLRIWSCRSSATNGNVCTNCSLVGVHMVCFQWYQIMKYERN